MPLCTDMNIINLPDYDIYMLCFMSDVNPY